MIKEDYVSFETAKLLKEKGFDEYCLMNYWESDKELHQWGWELNYGKNSEKNTCCKDCSAPTLQMAMKWLRVNYNIHIEPRYFPMPNIYRYVIIHSPTTIENIDSHPQYFNSYEEACDAAIKYCLENLI